MSLLKRSFLVILIFIVLLTFVSLFFPSSQKISKEVFFEADNKIVTQQLDATTFDIELENFTLKKEDVKYTLKDDTKGVFVYFEFNISYGFNPITKYRGLFVQTKINTLLDEKINQLKKNIEDLPKIHKVNVQKIHRSEILWYLSIRDTLNQLQENNIHGKLINEVENYISTNQLNEIYSPIVIYHYWSDSIIDIEAGIPVEKAYEPNNNRIKLNKIDTGNYVTATHYGAYERLPETYFGINEWMRKNEVHVIGAPWEMYVTDPSGEPNPDKWETIIYFPIE
ncbi:MAG: hypothetical protein COW67_02360 [Flavobacteriales bacterium CG18_big_fil_WC_8_21_14_2_50_32_9]|nr:hypothetical protein [Flavobacteriales bacterium]PIQ16537.1 MAG: hypothetical protein COW67_02360 [Flavobacteriales bacterium CG18_big_fil_WC_8_21_14_2_50_32_9]PIZ05451.1 MAG: hypothetical protein COY57_07225 [Flavobacteriales bacterium CG_4_10_14_0_8_um_filter_32_5]PJC61710.1 MAG: hypothetical protein CO022_08340 [Flavobacteriales bacterium CG_4_9_14_0_2_um_filter_32_27]